MVLFNIALKSYQNHSLKSFTTNIRGPLGAS